MTDPRDLELENQDLTDAIVSAYETIESAIEMTDFLDTLTSASPLDRILELTGERLNSIIPFDVSAFYLVNDDTGELELYSCRPAAEAEHIKSLIAEEMEKGNIHIALRDQRPMLRHIEAEDRNRLLLHSISTTRRCRGLFAGVFSHGPGHGGQADSPAFYPDTVPLCQCPGKRLPLRNGSPLQPGPYGIGGKKPDPLQQAQYGYR